MVIIIAGFVYYSNSFAMEDTTWQNDYYFSLDSYDNKIQLHKYLGSDKEVILPATAVISGHSYKTSIGASTYQDCQIDSFSAEEGVVVYTGSFL